MLYNIHDRKRYNEIETLSVFQILKSLKKDLNWLQAKAECETYGAHLPKPTAEWQHDILKSKAGNKVLVRI